MLRKNKGISFYSILLICVIATMLFLTFQDSAGTVKLSEGIRIWVEQFGIKTDFHSFRSNAHLVVYFVFGIVLSLFGREHGFKWWIVLLVGAGFGLIDESLKVLLPTREFEASDLIRNWIGVSMSILVTQIIQKIKRNRRRTRI